MANGSSSNSNESMKRFTGVIYPDLDEMRIPREFVKYWQGRINTGSCFVTDPRNNTISLAIVLDGDDFGMFTHGIRKISDFYCLMEKHNAYFKYVGNNDFWIRVCSVDGEEIDYPLAGFETDIDEPFLLERLPNLTGVQNNDEMIEISSDEDDNPIADYAENSWAVKVKKAKDIKKNPLVIPAKIVYRFFMNNQQSILIEDECRRTHRCKLLRNLDRRDSECYIGGHSWYEFCKESAIKKGDTLQFTVTEDSRKIRLKIIRA